MVESQIDIQINAELCKRSFYEFFLDFWDTIEAVELVPNWHIKVICDELQLIFERWKRKEAQPDAIFNVPPGSSKSTIIVQLFPAWVWVNEPGARFISSSYAEDIAVKHAVKTRDCINSDKFQAYYPNLITLKSDSNNKTAYSNTKMGERFTTSTGSNVTGTHGDFILVDDPINPKKSNSEVERKAAINFLKETLSTRKTDKNRSVTILVMQRLHEQDPTGEWLERKKGCINHICLPGTVSNLVKPEHLKYKYKNGLLDEIRLNREALQRLKTDLGSYGYAGQIDQSPSPEGGGILKKEWFDIISYAEFLTRSTGHYITWNFDADTAYTAKQENDPSAFMASCELNGVLYIRKCIATWLEFPELVKQLPVFVMDNGYDSMSMIYVEPKASGKSTIQTLRNDTKLNITEAPSPSDDKITRTKSIAPFCESKRVILIDGFWNVDFLEQLAVFPNGAHDDMLDCLVQAATRSSIEVVPMSSSTIGQRNRNRQYR